MWHGIHGHDQIVEQFRRAICRGRLASSFLFAGPAGIGKRTFALKLAAAVLCENHPEEDLDPCGECPSCTQVAAGTHPDVEVVRRPEERSIIPVDLFIGDREHRGREGLCHNISMKPFMGGRKMAVIDDADHLNAEGANCLLKTLEEPPPKSILILIGTSPARQLPTIRSRCQLIRFNPLPRAAVAELLVSRQLIDDPTQAARLAQYSDGSLQQAMELADAELWEFRGKLFERLADPVLDSVRFSKAVASFVDEAGKAAALRRGRMRQIARFAVEFYRQLLRAQNGAAASDDSELAGYVTSALDRGATDQERTAARLDRCLLAAGQIDRNANQNTMIEAWLDDLA